MSGTEVAENKALENSYVSQSDLLRNGSNNAEKEKSKEVQKEYAKNKVSTQLEVSSTKDCHVEGSNEGQIAEFDVDKVSTEISKNENSLEKSVTGLAVDSKNASNSVYSEADQSIASKLEALRKSNAIKDICYGEFGDCHNVGIRSDVDYKSHFDAMFAEVLEETGNDVPHDDIQIILSSGCVVDDSAESLFKASSAEYKDKEREFLSQLGPRDLIFIPDSRLFFETEEEYAKETTDGDDAGLTYAIDRLNKSLDTEMNEHVSVADSKTERKMHALKIQVEDFNAKHIVPVVVFDQNTFRISIDVSLFDIENITCVVGDKVDVRARVSRRSDYGFETHEIHQVFELPSLVDREKFTACVKKGLLHLEAPMKQSTC